MSTFNLRYHYLFSELSMDVGIPVDEAVKRSEKWASVSDQDINLEAESHCIGEAARESRRMAARAYLIILALLVFDRRSSSAICDAARLVQRWNLLINLFSSPSTAVRVFTVVNTDNDNVFNLLRTVNPCSSVLRDLDCSILELQVMFASGWTDNGLERLGRALFYVCPPSEHYSGLDFNMIRLFHAQFINLIDFLSVADNREGILKVEAMGLSPISCGDLSPQTISTVLNHDGVISGLMQANQCITETMKLVMQAGLVSSSFLKCQGVMQEDYTQSHVYIRENEPIVSSARHPSLIRAGFDERTNVLRSELTRHSQMGPIVIVGRGNGSLGRTFTEDMEAKSNESSLAVLEAARRSWHEFHPLVHPIGIRLLFIYLSLELYEHSFSISSLSILHQWVSGWPLKSNEVLSNWLTTHVPVRVIHDQVALCQSAITTNCFCVNLKTMMTDPEIRKKTLLDYGIGESWVKSVKSAMSHLQFLAHCNNYREILCEVSPDNPKVVFGYSQVTGAAARAAVSLNRPLVFNQSNSICPVELIKQMVERRRTCPVSDADDDIPLRIIDGYLHHKAFYNLILNARPTEMIRRSPASFGSTVPMVADELSPLMRYECIKWLGARDGDPELDAINRPAIIDSSNKYRLLQIFSNLVMAGEVHRDADHLNFFDLMTRGLSPYFILEVRRDHLLADTLKKLNEAQPNALRKVLRVSFIGEEGVDEGGLRKEFFQLLMEQLFNPLYGMFIMNEQGTLWLINPALDDFEDLQNYVLVGLIFGLALYNSILLDAKLPRAIFKLLLGIEITMQDLAQIDYEVARSLWSIVDMSKDEFDYLALTWSVDTVRYGETTTVKLVSHRSIDHVVAYEERHAYVDAYVKWRCFGSIEKQVECFRMGFYKVLSKSLLGPLDLHPEELEDLVIGCQTLIDVDSLKDTCQYGDGYLSESPTVNDFWNVCREFCQEDIRKLLWFVTGSDRLPVGGPIDVKMTIIRNSGDCDLLPSAHTCFNYLMLPDYQNISKLRTKLRIAIENAQGFGLQ
eukprot:GHVH01010885.1.p1 GENE.GHVH01010885.1~~GHVH01010885.1.p1  ORF type:complete len:1024 (+),score=146.35 GHVH01010885.1:91-3162(+)